MPLLSDADIKEMHGGDCADVEALIADRQERTALMEASRCFETDWRRCPTCGMDWPHPSVTSDMRCPRCKVASTIQERVEREIALVSLVNQCLGSLEMLAPEIAQAKLKRLRELGYGEEKL